LSEDICDHAKPLTSVIDVLHFYVNCKVHILTFIFRFKTLLALRRVLTPRWASMDISTKVRIKLVANRNLQWCKTVCIRKGADLTYFFEPLENHKPKANEEVQRRGHATGYEKGEKRSLRRIWGSISHLTDGRAENKYKSNFFY